MIKSLIATRSKGADEGRAHGVQELAGGLSGVLVHATEPLAALARARTAPKQLVERCRSARKLRPGSLLSAFHIGHHTSASLITSYTCFSFLRSVARELITQGSAERNQFCRRWTRVGI